MQLFVFGTNYIESIKGRLRDVRQEVDVLVQI